MQIKVKNVSTGKLNDINFEIEDKKITGIISNDIFILEKINKMLKENKIDSGSIEYSVKYAKSKMYLISMTKINDVLSKTGYEFLETKQIDEKKLKSLELDKDLLNRKIEYMSTSEKIKILLLKSIVQNYDTILIDGILEQLDSSLKNKIMKLILRLKKFEGKTIVFSSTKIDSIYEYIDNLVIITKNFCLTSTDKYKMYEENKQLYMGKPFVIKIKELIYNKKGINLGKNDSVNELIKAIYREIR